MNQIKSLFILSYFLTHCLHAVLLNIIPTFVLYINYYAYICNI